MKNLVVLFSLILISIANSFAGKPVVLNAEAAAFAQKNKTTNEWEEWSDWFKVSLTIVIKDGIIAIDNKNQDKFTILEVIGKKNGKEGKDNYAAILYKAINKDNDFVGIKIKIYDDAEGTVQLYIYEDYLKYVYTARTKGKKNSNYKKTSL